MRIQHTYLHDIWIRIEEAIGQSILHPASYKQQVAILGREKRKKAPEGWYSIATQGPEGPVAAA